MERQQKPTEFTTETLAKRVAFLEAALAEKDVVINGKTMKSLNLTGFGSGIYLLNLQNDEMKITQKILVK